MTSGIFFLASLNGAFSDLTPELKETLSIFAGLLCVVLLCLVWILYFRKPSRGHQHQHRSHSRGQNGQKSGMAEPVPPATKKRRVRRSSHPQRSFNPTLAQTHGLPPLRDEQQNSTTPYSS